MRQGKNNIALLQNSNTQKLGRNDSEGEIIITNKTSWHLTQNWSRKTQHLAGSDGANLISFDKKS